MNIEMTTNRSLLDEYKCIVANYEAKDSLYAQKDSLHLKDIGLEKEKNTTLKDLLDNRNAKIKSITTQRNVIGGIAIAVIIIVLF